MDKLQKARKEIAGLKASFNELIRHVDNRKITQGFYWKREATQLDAEYIKARVETAERLGFEAHVTVADGALHINYVKKLQAPCYV